MSTVVETKYQDFLLVFTEQELFVLCYNQIQYRIPISVITNRETNWQNYYIHKHFVIIEAGKKFYMFNLHDLNKHEPSSAKLNKTQRRSMLQLTNGTCLLRELKHVANHGCFFIYELHSIDLSDNCVLTVKPLVTYYFEESLKTISIKGNGYVLDTEYDANETRIWPIDSYSNNLNSDVVTGSVTLCHGDLVVTSNNNNSHEQHLFDIKGSQCNAINGLNIVKLIDEKLVEVIHENLITIKHIGTCSLLHLCQIAKPISYYNLSVKQGYRVVTAEEDIIIDSTSSSSDQPPPKHIKGMRNVSLPSSLIRFKIYTMKNIDRFTDCDIILQS
jgi:UDP-N-acetylglucosamine transferase subunit ALG13